MKNLINYLNESMSTRDLADIEDVIREISQLSKKIDIYDKISDEKGEGPSKEMSKILDRYDPYMEDVLLLVAEDDMTPADAAKEIKRMAEENERKEGTEPYFALDFLQELLRFLQK